MLWFLIKKTLNHPDGVRANARALLAPIKNSKHGTKSRNARPCVANGSKREAVVFVDWTNVRLIQRLFLISWNETKNECSGDLFGIWWTPFSYILLCMVLSQLFMNSSGNSELFNFLYVYCGFSVWMAFNKAVTSSVNFINGASQTYLHNNLSLFESYVVLAIKCVLIFLLNVPFIIFTMVFLGSFSVFWFLYFVSFLIIFFILVIFILWIVSALCLVYRVLAGMTVLGMRFLFFCSPVFWGLDGSASGLRVTLHNVNPISYVINAFRLPSLKNDFGSNEIIGVMIVLAFLACVSFALFLLIGRQIRNVT